MSDNASGDDEPPMTLREPFQPSSERWEEADGAPPFARTLPLGTAVGTAVFRAPNAMDGAPSRSDPTAPARGADDPDDDPLEWDHDGNANASAGTGARSPTVAQGAQAAQEAAASGAGLEFLVVEEHQSPTAERRAWRAAEVWTKRRVYGIDSAFNCIEILDRQTGRRETAHPLLGARLGGGRRRERDAVKFSYPFPLPGMEAMFSTGKKYGYTSVVERMVVRVRVLKLSPGENMPSWEDIANRTGDLPPKA